MIWSLLAGCSSPDGAGASVVLVTLDTTRADRITSYGYAPTRTAVIDGLAAEGARFEAAFTVSPQTTPAHASILSGLYPPAHGVRTNGGGTLPEEVETVAERFRAAGYQTVASVGSFVVTRTWNVDQGFDLYLDDLVGQDPWTSERPASAVMQDVQQHLKDFDAEKPLFLWVHLYDPHEPYTPPGFFGKRGDGGYDGEIGFADAQIGRLRNVLERWDPERRWAWVVVGDHGEGFDDPERGHGTFLTPATARVPLVIRPAHPLDEPLVVEDAVSVADVAPTLLALAALDAPSGLDGVDLTPFVAGEPFARGPVYAEAESSRVRFGWAPQVAVFEGSKVWLDTPRGGVFDWKTDPAYERPSGEPSAEARALVKAVRARTPVGASGDLGGLGAQLEALGYAVGDPELAASTVDARDRMADVLRLDQARQLGREAATAELAARLWQEALTDDPELLEARLGLIAHHERLGEVDAALALVESAPGEPSTPLQLAQARLLFQAGRPADVQAACEQILARDPSNRIARDLLVSTLPAAEGLARVEAWKQAAPEDPFLDAKQGQLLLVIGRVAEAEAALKRAAVAERPWVGVHRALGSLALMKGDKDGATAAYTREIELYPEDPMTWHTLGQHLMQTGNLKGAQDIFEGLVNRRPNDRLARQMLAYVYINHGNFDGADRALAPLLPSDDPRVQDLQLQLLAARSQR